MTRQEAYIAELSQLLFYMTPWDKAAALKRITKMMEESDNEFELLEELGSPMKLAVKLHREYEPTPEPTEEELAARAAEEQAASQVAEDVEEAVEEILEEAEASAGEEPAEEPGEALPAEEVEAVEAEESVQEAAAEEAEAEEPVPDPAEEASREEVAEAAEEEPAEVIAEELPAGEEASAEEAADVPAREEVPGEEPAEEAGEAAEEVSEEAPAQEAAELQPEAEAAAEEAPAVEAAEEALAAEEVPVMDMAGKEQIFVEIFNAATEAQSAVVLEEKPAEPVMVRKARYWFLIPYIALAVIVGVPMTLIFALANVAVFGATLASLCCTLFVVLFHLIGAVDLASKLMIAGLSILMLVLTILLGVMTVWFLRTATVGFPQFLVEVARKYGYREVEAK